MTRLLVPIALVIFVGIVQVALEFYVLNAGSVTKWGGTILVIGMLFNVAIIVYTASNRAKDTARKA